MTLIFKSYEDFLLREDKEINGVSPKFAERNPNYEADNSINTGCWNCFDCWHCEYCEECRCCNNCEYCEGCLHCENCEECRCCNNCEYCEGCLHCENCENSKFCEDCDECNCCEDCYGLFCKNNRKQEYYNLGAFVVPEIQNMHQKVMKAVSEPNALNMKEWHTCSTTHCWAGWIVVLTEGGRSLEGATSTPFAALQIAQKSSPIKIKPSMFYDTNTEAINNIKRFAEEELKLQQQ